MSKIILSINAGSSSVKISVYQVKALNSPPLELAETQIDGLTAPPPELKYTRGSTAVCKGKQLSSENIKTQNDAFKYVLDQLIQDKEFTAINKKEDIAIVCHRVVHGGDYETPQVIDADTCKENSFVSLLAQMVIAAFLRKSNEVYFLPSSPPPSSLRRDHNPANYHPEDHHLEALTDLAPLHNASALEIVKFLLKELPSAKNVAVFDSEFHQTIPEHIRTYPIDQEIAKKNKLRKYGFHGISYSFITRSAAEFLGKKEEDTNLIVLHLGSGASACAIKGGKSWDTSMGLTPLAGLPGATRSGSVDPSLVFHYASDVGKLSPSSTESLHISRAEEILNKECGWKALTGTTNFGTIASSSDPKMVLAFDIFVDRILSYIGHYYVSLHGKVDALVFAGGIGEKSEKLRARVVSEIECLGFEIDEGLNGEKIEGVVQEVGKKGARHRTLVCQTNEQFEMARYCAFDEKLFA